MSRLIGLVSCGFEEVVALLVAEQVAKRCRTPPRTPWLFDDKECIRARQNGSDQEGAPFPNITDHADRRLYCFWGRLFGEEGVFDKISNRCAARTPDVMGRVSKMGQRDIRRLLISGAMAVIRWEIRKGDDADPWIARLLARKPRLVAAVALANKMARMIWATVTKKQDYQIPAAA